MYLQRVRYSNFRCFGPEPVDLELPAFLAAFVGDNGSGKTATLAGLVRMFGTSNDARRVRRTDFHVPPGETEPPSSRDLFLEAILAFPELSAESGDSAAVPQFFRQMVIEDTGQMIVRLRLEATWTNEGSVDGAVTQRFVAVSSLAESPGEDEVSAVAPHDRARVQMIYVPPAREASRQLTQFLRSRLWRAAQWSSDIRQRVTEVGDELDAAFTEEPPVKSLTEALKSRWSELHSAGNDSTPHFRAIDREFIDVVDRVGLYFEPAASGGERRADELSEGQQSLLQLAMTAATLDVEDSLVAGEKTAEFDSDALALPALTLVAVEEPENSLSPFYLSRIISQLEGVASTNRAQAMISSHSASVLRRIDPRTVRYFRLDDTTGQSSIRRLTLPTGTEEEEKYVREAVRAYPEIYFARAVVLGEGASEQVVLPALAAAKGIPIDQSFVAVVPLGGRHVNHMWRLLHDLGIPHLTLLDLDRGRSGGGARRVKGAIAELLANGLDPASIFGAGVDPVAGLAAFDGLPSTVDLDTWLDWLRRSGVFFSEPLDLDWSMLSAYPDAYKLLESGMVGPSNTGDVVAAVCGSDGDGAAYAAPDDMARMLWYRYLFLNRGKPSTHLRVLATISDEDLANATPPELSALIDALAEIVR